MHLPRPSGKNSTAVSVRWRRGSRDDQLNAIQTVYIAGVDLRLPLVLAGSRAFTRFDRACASQRQLASASESVIDLSTTASLHQIGNIPSPLVDLPQWTVS